VAQPYRVRRSCLAVPGSNLRMLEKAQGLNSDQVFLDLEDSVAPVAKEAARRNIVAVLRSGHWGHRIRTVRVNDLTTKWTVRDILEIVEGAGDALDCIMLPKVANAGQVQWLDITLAQLERTIGLTAGSIGIEAQIESPAGLMHVEAIAGASKRLQALIFGPADFMASINMPSLVVGGLSPAYPGDPYHYALMRILVAARAFNLQAIDGPYLMVHDTAGFAEVARRSHALGFDGKWVLHPSQIDTANEIFSPSEEEYTHAELILEAYEHAISQAGGATGAVMLGQEMIDEASHKMALVIAQKGRAAGLRTPGGLCETLFQEVQSDCRAE
jgi:citrate lyase subunit beta / citryl-CoA lyase